MTGDGSPVLRWKGSVVFVVLAAAALIAVASTLPKARIVAAQVFVVVVGAVAIRLLVRAVIVVTSRPGPFAFDRAMVPPPDRELASAGEPERIEYEVGAATHRSMELHHQVRRRLRALAQDRLAADHGVRLDEDPDAARRLLGEEAWDLLRPDPEPPADRFGPGMPVEDVARIVTAVEDLSKASR
jgi:hypothetical protein